MMKPTRRYYRRPYRKAVRFSLTMLAVGCLSLLTAALQTPAFILGSELNGDGSVEYLCLGGACDSLPDFHWAD